MNNDSGNTNPDLKDKEKEYAPPGTVYIGGDDGAAYSAWDIGWMGDIAVDPGN